jgi:hypothetical protein
MTPPCLAALAAAVTALETCRPSADAVTELEKAIAACPWDRPPDRETAQALVLRLARLRLGGQAAAE